MGSLVRDVRHGVRILIKNPAFTATAVLSLALGIGANSALFSIFNSLLWKPLPVSHPAQIVAVYSTAEGQAFSQGFSYPEFRDYTEQVTALTDLVAFTPVDVAFSSEGGENTRAFVEAVSGNYFRALGVVPAIGRAFGPDEAGGANAQPLAILSHLFWERRFASNRAIIGRTVKLNGHAYTVIGVAPPDFAGAYAIFFTPHLWIPLETVPRLSSGNAGFLEDRRSRGLRLLGRLKPGVDVPRAQAEVATIAARLAAAYPDVSKGRTARVYPELATRPEVEISRATNVIAMIFLGLTGLVLLIACANVANLLLARSAARQREIAVRLAVGAGRGHLIRQLLTESLVLALAAGVLGLGIGYAMAKGVASIQVPTDFPLSISVAIDLRVVLFTFVVSVLASVAFGLVPALQASRPNLVPALKGETVNVRAAGRKLTLRNALVVTQVAISMVLLVNAGLFLRSVAGARTIDPGFRIENRVLLSFNPTLIGFDRDGTRNFYRQLLERVRRFPGVEAATLAAAVPLDFETWSAGITIDGRPAEPGKEVIQVLDSIVDTDYFRTLGTPIVQGRPFTDRDTDTSTPVVIVNQTMAKRYWPGENPIGRRIRLTGADDTAPREVVGVAADGKYRQLVETQRAYLFLPASQNYRSQMTLVINTSKDAAGVIAAARREAQAASPAMPIFEVKTMAQHMERAYLGPRLSAMLIGPAGFLALVIAAVGLYGVMAYSVSQRTREIGIRVAIGARPADVLASIMRQGLGLAVIGLVAGLAAALASTRLVANLLYGVAPTDLATFLAVPALLLLVSAAATYLPARRALRVDPLTALRSE